MISHQDEGYDPTVNRGVSGGEKCHLTDTGRGGGSPSREPVWSSLGQFGLLSCMSCTII